MRDVVPATLGRLIREVGACSGLRTLYGHGVIDRNEPRDFFAMGMFTEAEEFEAQVAVLAREWRPMAMAEVAEHLDEGRPFPPRAVHLSFDDGYRNALVAAEILDRHRVPWTLFVVADAVLDGFRPWYSRLADALSVSRTARRRDGSTVDLTDVADAWSFEREVKAEVLGVPTVALESTLERVLASAGLTREPPPRWEYLHPEDIGQLHSAGVEIGNHSARHVNLAHCDDVELEREVVGSRNRLEEVLGAPVRCFSYPDGRFDGRVIRTVKASHDLAMATRTVRPPMQRYAIRRAHAGGTVDQMEAILASAAWYRPFGVDPGAWRSAVSVRARQAARRLPGTR